jgi:hypothetical protein
MDELYGSPISFKQVIQIHIRKAMQKLIVLSFVRTPFLGV